MFAATNNGIEHLNLSWNQLRRKGAVALCSGIKVGHTTHDTQHTTHNTQHTTHDTVHNDKKAGITRIILSFSATSHNINWTKSVSICN